MKKPRDIRFAFISDTHGDRVDHEALSVALHFIKRWWKPEIRIHGGDLFDFRWIRSKANLDDQRDDPNPDINAGYDIIDRYKPTHMLWGNHDDRLFRIARSTDMPHARHAQMLADQITDKLDCPILPYDKRRGILRFGNVAFLHGYTFALNAMQMQANYYGTCVAGHTHRVEARRAARYEGCVGYGAGCMCLLDQDYNLGTLSTLQHGHGFVYGTVRPNGRCAVFQAFPLEGVWNIPTEMRGGR